MASWLLAYANSFVRADKVFFDYMVNKKDKRMWVGTIESILAFAYLRFRQGAKFRLKKGFKIMNDHSHPVKVGDYNFNLQGIKRSVLGGDSSDLLNFKTPIYFSYIILKELRPSNRSILLKLAIESVNSQLVTYEKDIVASETLKNIKRILEAFNTDDGEHEKKKADWYINDDYLESPLTKKNIELWKDNLDILNRICILFNNAHNYFLEGKNPDVFLSEIRKHQENIRIQMEKYLMQIPIGRSNEYTHYSTIHHNHSPIHTHHLSSKCAVNDNNNATKMEDNCDLYSSQIIGYAECNSKQNSMIQVEEDISESDE